MGGTQSNLFACSCCCVLLGACCRLVLQRLVAGALAERSLSAGSVRAQASQRKQEMDRVTEWMEKLGREGSAEDKRSGAGKTKGGAGRSESGGGACRVGSEHVLQLSAQQQEVVRGAAYSPTMVLTGGPGCGKTFTTRTVAQLWRAMGKKVCHWLASPAPSPGLALLGWPVAQLHRTHLDDALLTPAIASALALLR